MKSEFHQSPPLNGHSRTRAPEPSRPLVQQNGRGTKRAHGDTTAELPPRSLASEESGDPHGYEQPRNQKTHQTKTLGRKRIHDEIPGREGHGQPRLEDRSKVRHDTFVAYYHSKRKEHKDTNPGKDQSAFVRGFIDGIKDPDYAVWFQETLKDLFPENAQDAKRPDSIPSNRTITVKNLTWEDVKTVVKDIPIPYFAGRSN
jgi:hypothetical protein